MEWGRVIEIRRSDEIKAKINQVKFQISLFDVDEAIFYPIENVRPLPS